MVGKGKRDFEKKGHWRRRNDDKGEKEVGDFKKRREVGGGICRA